MTERPVANFPDYVVRDDGVVLRVSDLRPRSTDVRNGYLRVQLRNPSGQRRWRPVHLLVLDAFVGPRPSPCHHGAHKNGDKTNNRVDNLEWKLPKANEADKRLHGTAPKGGARKPTHPLRVRAIVRRVLCGESYTSVSKRYGLHRHAVSRIVRGLRRRGISLAPSA